MIDMGALREELALVAFSAVEGLVAETKRHALVM
jgi:hypothetical protein